MREVIRKKIKLNFIDKAVSFLSPTKGIERLKSRTMLAIAASYTGASKARRSLSEWTTSAGDADTDIIDYLPTLRERSRDLIRNNSLACGAINTKVTHIAGTGLTLQARIDRDVLGLTEEQADAWEKRTEAEWKLWSKYCDVEKTLNFQEIQALVLRSTLENGDVFVLTPAVKKKTSPYQVGLQTIEADRICNPDNKQDTDTLAGGVEKDEYGAPTKYHILQAHPGKYSSPKSNKWIAVPAYGGKTGRRNILHLYSKLRVGQTRGVPDLAPVIEDLKQMGRYTEAEISAAVISSFFTVFIKSEYSGGIDVMEPDTETGGKASDKDYKMGSGAMLDLNPNEDVSFANPTRPSQTFDPFILAMSRQIGVALELPFEMLVKHFTASYSAARAAMLEAWHFFLMRRKWLADNLCRPVYELFLWEAVASGRISAPGFLSGDPLIREAYLGSEWIGPAKGQIDEKKEIDAAEKRINVGISTLEQETASLTGGDWEKNHEQSVREKKARDEAGLGKDNSGGTVGEESMETDVTNMEGEDEDLRRTD